MALEILLKQIKQKDVLIKKSYNSILYNGMNLFKKSKIKVKMSY